MRRTNAGARTAAARVPASSPPKDPAGRAATCGSQPRGAGSAHDRSPDARPARHRCHGHRDGAESVADVLTQAAPDLTPGALWIQTSTVGLEGADRLAGLAAEYDLRYVDAPVLGTRQPAEDGTLVILASGPDDVRGRCAPVFDAIGSRTLWLGAAGQGSRLKLVANAWVLTVLEVLERVREHFDRAVAAGYGEKDMATTYLIHRPK